MTSEPTQGAKGVSKQRKPSKPDQDQWPLIGYEYEYLGHPVRVVRSCPSSMPRYGHVEFESRFGDRSTCESGELGRWEDTEAKPTKQRATRIMLDIHDAIEDATTDEERELAESQLRRLKSLARP